MFNFGIGDIVEILPSKVKAIITDRYVIEVSDIRQCHYNVGFINREGIQVSWSVRETEMALAEKRSTTTDFMFPTPKFRPGEIVLHRAQLATSTSKQSVVLLCVATVEYVECYAGVICRYACRAGTLTAIISDRGTYDEAELIERAAMDTLPDKPKHAWDYLEDTLSKMGADK